MWLCFNDGFLSVVADRNDPNRLLVRARRRRDLLDVCGNGVEVLKDVGSDYRWRTFVDRRAFSELVANRIDNIGYTNFKNSVKDTDLHEIYVQFWHLHYRYQDQDKGG